MSSSTSPSSDEPSTETTAQSAADSGAPSGSTESGSDQQPTAREVAGRVGATNDEVIAYVAAPDPALAQLSRKHRFELIAELPASTAGGLLGPAALARHFIASAASGRYRDLFSLWRLFREHPDECKPVLSERQPALDKARSKLETATRLSLRGVSVDRLAADVASAEGLIWRWLREALTADLEAVGARPAVAAVLLAREPELTVPLPQTPGERWLAEASAARMHGPLAPALEQLLADNADRLPPTKPSLTLASELYPAHIPALLDRVPLDHPDIASLVEWVHDQGWAERLTDRLSEVVARAARADRARALALWHRWTANGLELALPDGLRVSSLAGLDPAAPETAALIAHLQAEGQRPDSELESWPEPQTVVDELADQNRQLAEKAYEAYVCAGLAVTLPATLEANPVVRQDTRCARCGAWTWVRPRHEERCPRSLPTTTSETVSTWEEAARDLESASGT
jgi:hypothetical protein